MMSSSARRPAPVTVTPSCSAGSRRVGGRRFREPSAVSLARRATCLHRNAASRRPRRPMTNDHWPARVVAVAVPRGAKHERDCCPSPRERRALGLETWMKTACTRHRSVPLPAWSTWGSSATVQKSGVANRNHESAHPRHPAAAGTGGFTPSHRPTPPTVLNALYDLARAREFMSSASSNAPTRSPSRWSQPGPVDPARWS